MEQSESSAVGDISKSPNDDVKKAVAQSAHTADADIEQLHGNASVSRSPKDEEKQDPVQTSRSEDTIMVQQDGSVSVSKFPRDKNMQQPVPSTPLGVRTIHRHEPWTPEPLSPIEWVIDPDRPPPPAGSIPNYNLRAPISRPSESPISSEKAKAKPGPKPKAKPKKDPLAVWEDPDGLFLDGNSPLFKQSTPIDKIISHETAYAHLSSLPDYDEKLSVLALTGGLKRAILDFKADGRDERFEDAFLEQGLAAMQDRAEGKFDEYREARFAYDWDASSDEEYSIDGDAMEGVQKGRSSALGGKSKAKKDNDGRVGRDISDDNEVVRAATSEAGDNELRVPDPPMSPLTFDKKLLAGLWDAELPNAVTDEDAIDVDNERHESFSLGPPSGDEDFNFGNESSESLSLGSTPSVEKNAGDDPVEASSLRSPSDNGDDYAAISSSPAHANDQPSKLSSPTPPTQSKEAVQADKHRRKRRGVGEHILSSEDQEVDGVSGDELNSSPVRLHKAFGERKKNTDMQ